MTDFFSLTPEQQAQRMQAAGADALRRWGIQGAELSLIKYRENAVFRVDHDGGRHALRMHRAGYHSDDELRSELQWMQALQDAGIRTPTVVPTQAGELFVKHAAAGLPGSIQVDLFEWISGEQIGSVEDGISDQAEAEKIFGTIGEIAAQVHNQAAAWSLPADFTRHAWDEDGLAGDNPFWGRFWELGAATDAQRALLKRVKDVVYQDLKAMPKTPDTYSMIHADFAPENLMMDENGVRLIDFDDAGFGWHLFEIATSVYFLREDPAFDAILAATIRGYRQHRELTDQQLENLPLIMLARGTTYVGWVHTRHETETAQELTPMILEMACDMADAYLGNRQ
ncbi:MAG: phosphotransferase [Gammaproteobacteria bacterium]|nr:phosphotransferase [Gammaproteobacteria bacterium]